MIRAHFKLIIHLIATRRFAVLFHVKFAYYIWLLKRSYRNHQRLLFSQPISLQNGHLVYQSSSDGQPSSGSDSGIISQRSIPRPLVARRSRGSRRSRTPPRRSFRRSSKSLRRSSRSLRRTRRTRRTLRCWLETHVCFHLS